MTELPNGVDGIVKFLAGAAKGYNNHLKWDEEAKFKADLMNATERWLVIDAVDFEAACLEAGMRDEDAAMLTEYLRRRKQGRRLVAQRSYRNFKFVAPIDVLPGQSKATLKPSRDW